MPENFSNSVQIAMIVAEEKARRANLGMVDSICIFSALILNDQEMVPKILASLGVDIPRLIFILERTKRKGATTAEKLPLATDAEAIIQCAKVEAFSSGRDYINTEDILIAQLQQDLDGTINRILSGFGVNVETVRAKINKIKNPEPTLTPQEGTKMFNFSILFEIPVIGANAINIANAIINITTSDAEKNNGILLGVTTEGWATVIIDRKITQKKVVIFSGQSIDIPEAIKTILKRLAERVKANLGLDFVQIEFAGRYQRI